MNNISDIIKILLVIPVIVMAGVAYVLVCIYLGLFVYRAHLFIRSALKVRSRLWYKTKKKFKKDIPPYVQPVTMREGLTQLEEDQIIKAEKMKEEILLRDF